MMLILMLKQMIVLVEYFSDGFQLVIYVMVLIFVISCSSKGKLIAIANGKYINQKYIRLVKLLNMIVEYVEHTNIKKIGLMIYSVEAI